MQPNNFNQDEQSSQSSYPPLEPSRPEVQSTIPPQPITPEPVQPSAESLPSMDPQAAVPTAPQPQPTTLSAEQPVRLPIQTTEKSHKGLIFAIITVVVVLLLGGVGWATYTMLQNSKQTQNSTSQESNAVPVPSGWKRFTANAFGITFNTPAKWEVVESDPVKNKMAENRDLGYRIAVVAKEDGDDEEIFSAGLASFDIQVRKGTVDKVVDEIEQYNPRSDYKTETTELKWQGYDAKKITVANFDKTTSSLSLLYVQIGDYVFNLPDKSVVPSAVKEEKVSKEVYEQFVDSIRISKASVDKESQLSTETNAMTQGKDVSLGQVVVPAGWKTFQSKKYGISFATPSDWKVSEQYDGLNGAVLGMSVSAKEGSVSIMVSEEGLDDFTKKASYLYAAFGGGVKTKTEKMKWQGYDARRVSVTSEKNSNPAVTLFVRVGNYTYNIPDADDTNYAASGGKINEQTYMKFVDSIRIKES